MKSFSLSILSFSLLWLSAPAGEPAFKALLVAGGCCHDYDEQHQILYKGIQERANVRVDVFWTDDKTTNPPLTIYDDPNWFEGYDIVIHDECAASQKDLKVLQRILRAHEKIPAVHLHCAMHSFRTGTDHWFRHLGIQSTRHGPKEPVAIQFVDPDHPITRPLEDWTTGKEELYNNVEVFDGIHPLALGKQMVNRDGKKHEDVAIVAWTNEIKGIRSFSTTIGHYNDTVADPRYLDLVTRGLLWALGGLEEKHLVPYEGENTITFVKGNTDPKKKKAPTKKAVPSVSQSVPKDALEVEISASSVQGGRDPWMAIDHDAKTRWCASNGSMPQWLQLDFGQPRKINEIAIRWERSGETYRYRVLGSADGKSWKGFVDFSKEGLRGGEHSHGLNVKTRFLRLDVIGSQGGWASLFEWKVKGEGFSAIAPKLSEEAKKALSDPFQKEGNIKPKAVKLSPEQEKKILADTKVPEGFEVSLFAPSQMANYPVYVAAAPNGDLYVSSDGNGSLGRDPHRGRVLRLRDVDGDGRADEVTEFVKDVDSPRGLIWDEDRLYLLHPPHISVYHDKDGDGVAEDSERLIDNIAFGFADRPADHTTNGLEMGIDGWIYIAGGDFGFLEATGSDGTKLQHRGGGVIRFRPDGSGLELYATGTRNILGTPASPLLDLFARDNTNDGGGWDVRFHHFTGLEDHGYPRLYKNFPDEHVHPLADYGGGSGCGSVYIHEPGFPDHWNRAPFTCDWGRRASFRHAVKRRGATFEETAEPAPFIQMTRPTDADIDGMSAVYQASWLGATFKWDGPDVGYIVRVTPEGYEPKPLPRFESLSDLELVELLKSPSHVRTLAAQRALLRREASAVMTEALVNLASDRKQPLENRVAALFAISQRGFDPEKSSEVLNWLVELGDADEAIAPFAARALGDLVLEESIPEEGRQFVERLFTANDPRTRLETMVAVARQGWDIFATSIAVQLGSEDSRVAHTAVQALGRLQAHAAAFAVLDKTGASELERLNASLALMRMHLPLVVDGLIERADSEMAFERRRHLLMILARLANREGEWKGESWGTRPDTRGPYYVVDPWNETERILGYLRQVLEKADSEEAAFLVKEMGRNRIQSNEALTRILSLAREKDELIPDAVDQLVRVDDIPGDGVEILLSAVGSDDSELATISKAIQALSKVDGDEAFQVSLDGFVRIEDGMKDLQGELKAKQSLDDPIKAKAEAKYVREAIKNAQSDLDAATGVFLKSPKLENHHLSLEKAAGVEVGTTRGFWSNAGLLALASRKNGSPESRELSGKAIEEAWTSNPEQRVELINAAVKTKNRFLEDRIRVAMTSSHDQTRKSALAAAKVLKIEKPGADQTPKVGTMSVEEALSAVAGHPGDAALGEAIFARATCNACHTVSQDQPQKGPYLGNIIETYPRDELAAAILDPNRTIAQGFATNLIVCKDGSSYVGFVTNEAGDKVTLRDIAANEHTIEKNQIEKRETVPSSMMPPGLMNAFTVKELASLLAYLEAVNSKQ